MTITNFNQINTNDFKPRRDIIQLFLFIVTLVIIVLLKKSCNSAYLKKSQEVRGVVIEKSGGYSSFSTLIIEFKIEDRIITSDFVSDYDCYKKYNVGDSVNVLYSIEKPEIIEILECEED